ncbi:MAG: zinc ribbon domain-containing protein [Burkholderiaceae bacterium]|nr:zinc ribbon domain-containing protein [Burkholderiaceae bacterium]
MPIYAYKCGSCGHAKDVLQKMSDSPLSVCPACGAESFTKQLTAAGFQLKGSGWYVTDFRGGSGGTAAPATADKNSTPAAATDTPTSSTTTADAPKTVAASATPAPASTGSADKT